MYIVINWEGYVTDYSSTLPIPDSIKVPDLDQSEIIDFLINSDCYYFEDGDLLRDDEKAAARGEIDEFERRRENSLDSAPRKN